MGDVPALPRLAIDGTPDGEHMWHAPMPDRAGRPRLPSNFVVLKNLRSRRVGECRDPGGFVPLDDYGLVGNGRAVAVIALDGGVDWWAVPRLDAPPAFSALLDPADGGRCTLRPVDPRAEVTRRYLPGTNVLETTYRAANGTATVVDSLNSGTNGALPWSELGRRVTGVSGSVDFRLDVAPGTGLGRWEPWVEDDPRGALLHAGDTTLAVRLPAGIAADVRDRSVHAELRVSAGDRAVVGVVASCDRPLFLAGVESIDARIDLSVSRWREWSDQVRWTGPRRDQIVRSALALKLLLMNETGAIAAAATTSLPEMVGGPKNWDYRYCWIRDTVLTVDALSACGLQEEVHAAVSWLLRTIRRHGPDIHVMYTLDGDLLASCREAPVPGYRGSRPVRIGNDAVSQVQLGIYGELFGTVARWVDAGHVLDVRAARELADLADRCADIWRHDDAGIWELHRNRPYTSSKMNCWRALDAAARLAADGQLAGSAERWRSEADRIRAWVQEYCWSDRRRAYTFYAGADELDASVLLAAGYGFDTGERMSCPVSSRRRLLILEYGLERAVFGGVVGRVVVPTAPDDVCPGAGQDADGVGVVVAAGDGPVVEVFGPGVGVAGVAGEVAQRVAELSVGAVAEADAAGLAGLSGGRGDAGQAGQRVRGGEPAAGVADLDEQSGGADGAGTGQAGHDRPVGVDGELLGDPVGQGLDLPVEGAQHGDVAGGDRGEGVGVVADGAAWGCGDPLVQDGGVGSSAVVDGLEPGLEPFDRQPVGAGLGAEAFQEPQADVGVDVVEKACCGWEHDLQVGAQLVRHGDPVGDQVAAGADGRPQRGGLLGVAFQRPQPAAVGAHDVGQDVGVETVVLVAGRAVSAAQVLELRGRDDQDGQSGAQQRLDHRPVGAFDTDLGDIGIEQPTDQITQTGSIVPDGEPVQRLALGADHADRVVVFGPVDPRADPRRGRRIGHTHRCLLAVPAVGRHPVVPGRRSRSLTDRRSRTLSPVASRGALGHRASRNSSWTSRGERAGRWPGGGPGCAGDHVVTNTGMVHQ